METSRFNRLGPVTDQRTVAILIGSVALHVGVLAVLGLRAVSPDLFATEPYRPILLDIEPRPLLRNEAARRPALLPSSAGLQARRPIDAPLVPHIAAATPHTAPASPTQTAPVGPPPASRDDANIRRALRNSALGCRLGRSNMGDQEDCERAVALTTANASSIMGTGDAARDARMAADSADALANYERRRATLKPYSRAEPCAEGPSPSDPCIFAVRGRIWSNRDGWLPDLPGRR